MVKPICCRWLMHAGPDGSSVYLTSCGYKITCEATETGAVAAFTRNFAECAACHEPVELQDERSAAEKLDHDAGRRIPTLY